MGTHPRYSGGMAGKYFAYMLRLWQVSEGQNAVWRASLEDAQAGTLRAFASLELLIAFLKDRTQVQGGAEAAASDVNDRHDAAIT